MCIICETPWLHVRKIYTYIHIHTYTYRENSIWQERKAATAKWKEATDKGNEKEKTSVATFIFTSASFPYLPASADAIGRNNADSGVEFVKNQSCLSLISSNIILHIRHLYLLSTSATASHSPAFIEVVASLKIIRTSERRWKVPHS